MKRSFTLLEMLLVIAIIAVLTGIALPAAALARQKGRITTAKSDMHAIQLAFKALENTYGKMVNASKKFNGEDLTEDGDTYKYVRIEGSDARAATETKKAATKNELYNNVIIELSDPSVSRLKAAQININKRRLTVLEPKPEYNAKGTVDDNAEALWYDPWGKPYVILINTNRTNAIPDPANTSSDKQKLIGGSIILYSCGPDGVDDKGDGDDICSWK